MIMADASSAANTNLKKKIALSQAWYHNFAETKGMLSDCFSKKKEAELRNNHAETTHPQSFTNMYVNVITQVSHYWIVLKSSVKPNCFSPWH